MTTHPAPGWRAMARGSSIPPETRTEWPSPDRSDTEIVSVPGNIIFRTLDTWLSDHKSVLSWEQGLFRAEQFAVWVLFTGIARQCGIQIDSSSRLSVKFILCQEWKLRETENDAFPREALFSLKHATEPSKLDLHLTVHSLVIYSWLCWRGLLRLKNVKLKVKVNIQVNYSKSQMNCSI